MRILLPVLKISVLPRNISLQDGLLYIGVTRSRKIESERDYQKNKECVQEPKVFVEKGKIALYN